MLLPDNESEKPLYIQIYDALRDDIENGRITCGKPLLSSRRFAEILGVSRNTVALAYEKLISEGYISGRPRRGYFVEKVKKEVRNDTFAPKRKIIHDLSPLTACTENFPAEKWKRCMSGVVSESNVFYEKSAPFGDDEVKTEIRKFLYRHRGIDCGADDIFVFGSEEAALYAAFYLADGRVCADAVCSKTKKTAALAGREVIVGYGEKWFYRVPYDFLSWRRDTANCDIPPFENVIENDKGFLFCDTAQKPLFASKDENVVYMGTYSDILIPSAAVSYLVLKGKNAEKLRSIGECFSGVSPVLQKTAAMFMRDRNWERYLHKLAVSEKEKAALAASEIRRLSGCKVEALGRFIYIEEKNTESVREKAEKAGIGLEAYENGIVLGTGGIKKEDIPTAAAVLAGILSKK